MLHAVIYSVFAHDQLPLQASWQDLKDLMRQSGEVIRADVGMFPDGRPKGNGTVVFVNPEDAKAAIGELTCADD